jgi:murein DD-endopeptidase MepM/ murein hydrolase activator NlpD
MKKRFWVPVLVLALHYSAAQATQTIQDILVSPNPVYQGDTIQIIVHSKVTPNIYYRDQWRILYPIAKETFRFILGIPLEEIPQFQTVLIKTGAFKKETLSYQVIKKDFPFSRIDLPKAQGELFDGRLNTENAQMAPHYGLKTLNQLWKKNFVLPAKGVVSSAHGFRRDYYIDGKKSSHWSHKGLDIAAPQGTKVVAPNGGKIVLAQNFSAHGKTIMIDHGHGVVSVLIHLSEIKVKAGDLVKKGQVIGLMGASGIATGSNVHWGLSVNGVRVNPMQWIENPF